MSSFNTFLSALAQALREDAALKAFCLEKWKKQLTVKRLYKLRVELRLPEFPLTLITRPSVTKEIPTIGDGIIVEKTHRVRLYSGFSQPDPLRAQEDLIEFEELLEDAVLVYAKTVHREILPDDSMNDEGVNQPEYFLFSDYLIKEQRE